MKIFLSFIVAIILIVSCQSKDKKKTADENVVVSKIDRGDQTLLSDSAWGWVNPSHTIDSLKMIFGDSLVKDERICGAECADSVDVTIIYPNSNNEFIIYWDDSAYHKKIVFIRTYNAKSPYHTSRGIKMGTTLKEILDLNGKPISFSGLGWDYGGGIGSFNGGALMGSNVRFTLDITDNPSGDNSIYGDVELNTEMPAVKRLVDKIHVSELFLPFNR